MFRHFLPWPKSTCDSVRARVCVGKDASVLFPETAVTLQLTMHSFYLGFGQQAAMSTRPRMSYRFFN